MNRILKIGMDVHKETYTLCAIEVNPSGIDKQICTTTIAADYHLVINFIDSIKKHLNAAMDTTGVGGVTDDTFDIVCGYEAGCLGYSLYRNLTKAGINCVILAPSTMLSPQGKRVKNDKRDALIIAQCLVHNTYKEVYIPTEEYEAVQGFIRLRGDVRSSLIVVKNQIKAFCLRHGCCYPKTTAHWNEEYLSFLRNLELSPLDRETLDEYIARYISAEATITRLDNRIEEISQAKPYKENVKCLGCLLGVKNHTALSLIVETGDFARFSNPKSYASYLGLCPGEHSSGMKICHTSITKAGNSHLRTLLIEASQGICRGKVGHKSRDLQKRQLGNKAEVVAYADRANIRMRSRYYRLIRAGKKRNVAVTAVAKELSCFVWGMMMKDYYRKQQ